MIERSRYRVVPSVGNEAFKQEQFKNNQPQQDN